MSAIDKHRARQSFERAAASYDSVAVLQREIADRMLERLDYIRLEPKRILDIGTGTGYAIDLLTRRYPKARVIAVDFAHAMLLRARRRGGWRRRPHCLCADAEQLPIASGTMDLVVSNAAYQWCNDLGQAFADCLRVLSPGGLFMFTTFGPDTLGELRSAWSRVDDYGHVSPFLDMHDVGDALTRARFADVVMDAERLSLTYPHLRDLMRDLKILGAHNARSDRPRALTGRARIEALEHAYEVHRIDGRLPASYEVIYGHAWAPLQREDGGVIRIPIETIRRRERTA